MVKTEDTYLSMIEDQSSNSDIITIADLARADAFNLFVVSLRANWENYRNAKDNTIILRRADMDKNWDSFVDMVANDYFFERKFSQFFAQTILNKLYYAPKVIGYDIVVDTKGTGSGVGVNYTSDENALATIVEEMFENAGKKVDVVGCNQDSEDKCNGSFYLTFNTIDLNDEQYEKLPTITVRRERNNEVMQRPVLARQYYKIYMPWRGFQAMRVARRIAYSPEREMSENPGYYEETDDSGLFNPLLHNTLEQARLGVCDPGTCGPRTNFFKTSSSNGFDEQCNIPFEVNGEDIGLLTFDNFEIFTPKVSYNLGAQDQTEYFNLFNSLVKETITNNLNIRENSLENITFTNSLEMTTDASDAPDYTGINIYKPIMIDKINVYINGDGTITKKVETIKDKSPGTKGFDSVAFNPLNHESIADKAGGFGIFYDSINGRSVYASEIGSVRFPQLYFQENTNLRCFELGTEGIQLNLVFKEKNPKYSILNNEPKIYIKLIDSYTEFAFPSDAILNSYLDPVGYVMQLPDDVSPNGVTNLWECESYGDPNSVEKYACVSPEN
jgi:hypothetical protein